MAFSQAIATVLQGTGVVFADVVYVNATNVGSSSGTTQRRRLLQVTA